MVTYGTSICWILKFPLPQVFYIFISFHIYINIHYWYFFTISSISQWEPKSSTRTFGEAANMLLCHRDSMMPLGIFRYPKAGLGAGGRKTTQWLLYYILIIILIIRIIIIYIYNYIILSYLIIYYILVGCGGFDLNILRVSSIVFPLFTPFLVRKQGKTQS